MVPAARVLALLAFVVMVGFCFDDGGEMEEGELYGLFEVMGSLLEDSSWAEMHPSPCTDTPWPGVECELMEETSILHVTKIHVGTDVMSPPCKHSAGISESGLLKLPYLKTLSLMNCFIAAPVFLTRSVFESLPLLEHLALESNPSLSGHIPSTLSNLTNLKTLCLSQNNLSGEIPVGVSALVNLQQLDLSHNFLSGPIPGEIGSLEMLTILDLNSNSLQGILPDSVSNLNFLEKIDLSWNKLQGRLPEEMGKLNRLVLLDVSHNSLTGPIPETLSGLQELQYLTMEDNPVNSTLPFFTASLAKLRVLTLSRCGLTGPIPTTFSNLQNLTALSLDSNNLNGTVPTGLSNLPRLDTLNLSNNYLTGEVSFPLDFIIRLGERLDVRDNNGLCHRRGTNDNRTKPRFLHLPPCPSSNKTSADKSWESKYGGNKSSSSGQEKMTIPLSTAVVMVFLCFVG